MIYRMADFCAFDYKNKFHNAGTCHPYFLFLELDTFHWKKFTLKGLGNKIIINKNENYFSAKILRG